MLGLGALKLSTLGTREHWTLVAFSFLFTINIAISNVSLSMVSVPFHQIVRSTTPVITILIYRFAYARTYASQTYLTMIPLISGVALATVGDYYATLAGFTMTLLGVFLVRVNIAGKTAIETDSFFAGIGKDRSYEQAYDRLSQTFCARSATTNVPVGGYSVRVLRLSHWRSRPVPDSLR